VSYFTREANLDDARASLFKPSALSETSGLGTSAAKYVR
jgi:hypothetical protein